MPDFVVARIGPRLVTSPARVWFRSRSSAPQRRRLLAFCCSGSCWSWFSGSHRSGLALGSSAFPCAFTGWGLSELTHRRSL